MKRLTKLMTLVVVAMMATLAMTATAWAEGDEPGGDDPGDPPAAAYSITVQNDNTSMSIIGKTYTAYKLFDVVYDGTNYAYTIKTDNPFYTNEDAKNVLDEYFDFGTIASDATTKTVTVKTAKQDATTKTLSASDVRALADALQPYATGAGAGSAQATAETVTIDLQTAGYYIVTGTVKPTDPANSTNEVVSAVILDNADPTVTVHPKASVPPLDKKITAVSEGATEVDGAVLDADGKAAVAKVGSTVSYELTSNAPDLTGYDDYTFTFSDAITGGLDYVEGSFTLKVGDGEAATITPSIAQDGKSFTYTIPFATLETYTPGDEIVLSYNCTVNDSALSYDFENNTASLEYSNNPYQDTTNHTPEKKTYVIDLNLDVLKVDGTDNTKKLDGAEFKLYREVTLSGSTTREYYKWDTTNNKVTWTTTEGDADVFATGANGNLTQQVRGLDKGNYFLLEVTAPTGYNLLSAPIAIVISASEEDDAVTYTATYGGETATMTNGTVDLTAQTQSQAQPVATGTIENNSGAELPSTGGMGTTILYIIGAVLVIGAGVYLVTRRRMSKVEISEE